MNVATANAYETIEGKRYLRLTDEWRAARYTASRHAREREFMRVGLRKTADLLLAKNPALFSHYAMHRLGEINQTLDDSGMTLLHLSARLYAMAARRYDRKGQDYYAAATKCLLAAGANPLNTMRRWSQYDDAGHYGTSLDTPAAVCDGQMPPALRERMMQEAAAGNIPEYRPSSTDALLIARRNRTPEQKRNLVSKAYVYIRRTEGVEDTGTAWVARMPNGDEVVRCAYDPDVLRSRCDAHQQAATALRAERAKERKRAQRKQQAHRIAVKEQAEERRALREQLEAQQLALA